MQKKEFEFALAINNKWSRDRIYTFASFRGKLGIGKYHRIWFNLLAIAICLINSVQYEDASTRT